jgi:threonine synthase
LVLDHALRNGVQTVSCASTGNVGVSLAVGCGAVGINAVIFVPATVLDSKLSIMLAAGARVLKVVEGYEAAFRLSEEAAAAFGWGDRNTGVNPLTIEAKKTVAFEIWEQLGREMPDAIIVPVGDGPTLTALAKGFHELQLCGIDQRLPRIIGVQAAGCQPVKRAWERGGPVQPEVPNTIADGIAVSNPVAADLVIQDIRATNGAFVAVTDDEMLDAMQTLAAHSGIVAEPAGAAAFAGLMQALQSGLVDPKERVVALVTGTGFKTPQFLRPSASVATVHENLRDVEYALAR